MSYKLRGYPLDKINLQPATTEEEVLQNVAVIVATMQGDVPLDRGLGLAGNFVDKPPDVAKAIFAAEVYAAVAAREPRAESENITFESDETPPGKFIPVLEVNVNA
jgi:phage baseplate assembly protein W